MAWMKSIKENKLKRSNSGTGDGKVKFNQLGFIGKAVRLVKIIVKAGIIIAVVVNVGKVIIGFAKRTKMHISLKKMHNSAGKYCGYDNNGDSCNDESDISDKFNYDFHDDNVYVHNNDVCVSGVFDKDNKQVYSEWKKNTKFINGVGSEKNSVKEPMEELTFIDKDDVFPKGNIVKEPMEEVTFIDKDDVFQKKNSVKEPREKLIFIDEDDVFPKGNIVKEPMEEVVFANDVVHGVLLEEFPVKEQMKKVTKNDRYK